MTNSNDILKSLLVSAHRLTRSAAQSTGDTTSPAIWRTLSILKTDGPMRIGELATASRVAQPTMTKLVQNLAYDELVYRIADTDDARAWLIAVTKKGEKALQDWVDRLAESLSQEFADASPEEWAALAAAAEILDRRTSTAARLTAGEAAA